MQTLSLLFNVLSLSLGQLTHVQYWEFVLLTQFTDTLSNAAFLLMVSMMSLGWSLIEIALELRELTIISGACSMYTFIGFSIPVTNETTMTLFSVCKL